MSNLFPHDPTDRTYPHWDNREHEAKALGDDPKVLKKRILEAKADLKQVFRDEFKQSKWDIPHKRLWSEDGNYCLQWQARDRPDEPESYENQQSAAGTVVLLKLRKRTDNDPRILKRVKSEASECEL